jgi:hypothetical protein
MASLNNPIPTEWEQYVTQSAIGLEVIPDVLYDTKTIASAQANTVVTYFNVTEATSDLGNLQQPGLLPNPQSFLIQAIRFYIKYVPSLGTTIASNNANDLILLVNTGVLKLQIGEKRYGPYPLWLFSAGSYPFLSLAGALTTSQWYGQVGGPMYALYPNLMIAPLQNFFLTLEWPAGVPTLNQSEVCEVCFDGQRARAIQ